MEVRPGYKPTEIGVIPQDWDARTIDEIAFVTSGKRLPLGSSLVQNPTPHPYIRVTDMRPGTVDLSEIRYVPESVFPAIKRYRIFSEDLFISVAGSLGIVGKVPEELDGANLTENADRITSITCSQDFLLHVLMSPLIQGVIDSIQTVGAQPKLALTRIRKFVVPQPPLPEQRAIAAALNDIDTLLSGLDRLIAKKRDLKWAAMQQLLTGQNRLFGFQGAWGATTLRQAVATPITDGPHLTPNFLATGVPFLSVNNLVNHRLDFSALRYISVEDHIEFSKKCKPRRGDILFGKAASVGMVALVETDMELNIWSPLALIRVTGRMHERFVFYALQTRQIARQIKLMTNASSQGNIGMSDIGTLEIPVPSHSEQEAIAAVLSDMDAELIALEARRDKTRALKQGMMQELLTGRTRLV
jgi:type I restriction enzyme S subunit